MSELENLKKEMREMKCRIRINELKKKIEAQRQDEEGNLIKDHILPNLLNDLYIAYKEKGDDENAEQVEAEREELIELIENRRRENYYLDRRIEVLEKKAIPYDADSGVWYDLWRAYEQKGDKEKAEKAKKQYEHWYEKECNDGDLLRY